MSVLYGKSTPVPPPYAGVMDFVLDLPSDRPLRLLQLTDMRSSMPPNNARPTV